MPKGNRTERRGIKLRRDIRLEQVADREKLRRIWQARALHEPGLKEDDIVAELIRDAPEPTPAAEWEGQVL